MEPAPLFRSPEVGLHRLVNEDETRSNENDATICDPFPKYIALEILLFVVVVLFYGIIAVHDVPRIFAKARHDPHRYAIHGAGWVSPFTPYALGRSCGSGRWYRTDRG
jgi:hypothetical protein